MIDGLSVGNADLKSLLRIVKTNLPYVSRYAYLREKKKVEFYADFEVTLEKSDMTADEFSSS